MSYLRASTALRSQLLRSTSTTPLLRSSSQLHRLPTQAVAPVLSQLSQCRASSHSPMSPTTVSSRKKVTINTLRNLYTAKTPITVVTAHDFPSGLAADLAGVDIVLVGDSLAMVALGMEDTNELTLDAMIHHSRAVARAVKSAFIVADLPMGSYEISPEHAIKSSLRLIQEGRVHGVKLEGGAEMAPTIKRLTDLGIPVAAHIGLTPQRASSLGGFRVQGKSIASTRKLIADALAVQEAGCFCMVIEAVPAEIAEIVTKKLQVPTIGIGAGAATSGQVLVQMDMLGYYPEGRFMPKFVKHYGEMFKVAETGIAEYVREVRTGEYPQKQHTYPIGKNELEAINGFMKTQDEPSPSSVEAMTEK